jgi:hypothetical protein
MVHSPFILRGLSVEGRGNSHNPHAEARPDRVQQLPDNTVALAIPSGERTDVLRYAEFLDLRGRGNGRVGDERHLVESRPDLRSDGPFSQPTGVPRRRNPRKAKRTMGPDKAMPAQKRTRRRESHGFQDPTTVEVSFQTRG